MDEKKDKQWRKKIIEEAQAIAFLDTNESLDTGKDIFDLYIDGKITNEEAKQMLIERYKEN